MWGVCTATVPIIILHFQGLIKKETNVNKKKIHDKLLAFTEQLQNNTPLGITRLLRKA